MSALTFEVAQRLVKVLKKLGFDADDVKISDASPAPWRLPIHGTSVTIEITRDATIERRVVEAKIEEFIETNGFRNDIHPVAVDVDEETTHWFTTLSAFFFLRGEENSA